VSSKEPLPEGDPAAADVDPAEAPAAPEAEGTDAEPPAGRKPPGPGDKPISNLPPPPSADADEAPDPDPAAGEPGAETDEPSGGAGAEAATADPPADVPADGEAAADVAEADESADAGDAGVDAAADVDPAMADPEPADPEVAEDPTGAEAEADELEDTEGEAECPPTAKPAVSPATASPAAPAARTHRTRLTIAAVVVAIVASVLALTKAQQVGDLSQQRDDRRAVEEVAGRFGAAYLSYDFAHADASGKVVTALATAEFGRSYSGQQAPGIQQLFSSNQTSTKATTTAVYVGPMTGGRARALVVVDVTATSPTDGTQALDDVSFVLDLARTKLGWRVAKVARAPQPTLATTTSTTAQPG
jgi:hypothetical protein